MRSLFASVHDAVLFAVHNAYTPDYLRPTAPANDEDILVRYSVDPSSAPTLYVRFRFLYRDTWRI